jgi:hypothetical protein
VWQYKWKKLNYAFYIFQVISSGVYGTEILIRIGTYRLRAIWNKVFNIKGVNLEKSTPLSMYLLTFSAENQRSYCIYIYIYIYTRIYSGCLFPTVSWSGWYFPVVQGNTRVMKTLDIFLEQTMPFNWWANCNLVLLKLLLNNSEWNWINLRGSSPQANYTDRAIAACRWS